MSMARGKARRKLYQRSDRLYRQLDATSVTITTPQVLVTSGRERYFERIV